MELSFLKDGGSSYFLIKNIPKDTSFFLKNRYFIAFFKMQKAKKVAFKDNLGDDMFDGFFIENLKQGSRIIIKTKKGYKASYEQKGNRVFVRAVELKVEKIKPHIYKQVPKELVSLPFYISDSVFVKKRSQTTESYDETLFFTGVKMFAQRNYTMAVEFFKEIIKKYPNSKFYVSSHFLLGDCYKSRKDYAKAIEVYKQAIKLSPKNDTVAQTLLSMADIWLSKQYYSKARDIYKSVIKDYSTSRWGNEAKFLMAKSYYDQKRYKKAVSLFVDIDKKNEYYPLSFLFAAECFIKDKDDARAVLAYYSMSKFLNKINAANYHKELTDVAGALCRFNDYKAADTIFSYVEKTKMQDAIEESYLGRMRCDLLSGNLDDLKTKAEIIIHSSKNKDRIKKAQKLLDKAKLQGGDVDKKTIESIIKKYKSQPDIVSLALYVYAKKSYRNKNYKEALSYLLKLKKMFPASRYIKDAKPLEQDSINNLIDNFYKHPNKEKLDFIYNSIVSLNAYTADMCKTAVGLIVFGDIDRLSKILPYAKDRECKKALYAKYYIEKGFDKNALESLDGVEKSKPYIYFVSMVMGDINYFKNSYDNAYSFYKKAYNINNALLKDYLKMKMADTLMLEGKYSESLNYTDLKFKIHSDKIQFIKGLDYFNLKRYKKAVAVFKQFQDNLKYEEKALFYTAISYIKLKDKKNAKVYFDMLRKKYPSSRYLKTLKVLLQ